VPLGGPDLFCRAWIGRAAACWMPWARSYDALEFRKPQTGMRYSASCARADLEPVSKLDSLRTPPTTIDA
jgi:hypothetical protein